VEVSLCYVEGCDVRTCAIRTLSIIDMLQLKTVDHTVMHVMTNVLLLEQTNHPLSTYVTISINLAQWTEAVLFLFTGPTLIVTPFSISCLISYTPFDIFNGLKTNSNGSKYIHWRSDIGVSVCMYVMLDGGWWRDVALAIHSINFMSLRLRTCTNMNSVPQ